MLSNRLFSDVRGYEICEFFVTTSTTLDNRPEVASVISLQGTLQLLSLSREVSKFADLSLLMHHYISAQCVLPIQIFCFSFLQTMYV